MARNLRSGLRQSLKPTITGGFAANDLFTTAALDLNFAKRKNIGNLVDHTRASSGTYVGSDGLIKTAATNLLLYSEEFDTTWILSNINAFGSGSTANATQAPDGNLTADLVTETLDVSNTQHNIAQAINVSSGNVYTISLFAKLPIDSTRQLQILIANTNFTVTPNAVFDLISGDVTFSGNCTASILPYPNGWYRLILTTIPATSSGLNGFNFRLYDGSSNSYIGDGNSGIYLWGAQLEQSSTVGEYVKTTSTINSAPRFDHDPTTGESLGLLVEESKTNLMLQSQALTTSPWSDSGATTSVASTITDVFGGTSASFKLTEDNANSAHFIDQGFTLLASTSYSVTAWFKQGSANRDGRILLTNATTWDGSFAPRARIEFSTGTVQNVIGFTSANLVPYSNGWYRFTGTALTSASGGATSFRLLVSDGSEIYQGDGTSHIYVGPCQLEEGSFPTSYIPTEGTTVTRADDVVSISGSNYTSWANNSAGTIFTDSKVINSTLQTQTLYHFDGPSYDVSLRQPQATGDKFRANIGNVFTPNPGTGDDLSSGVSKAAVAYTTTTGRLQVGAASDEVTMAGALDATELFIGSLGLGTHLNGTVKRFVFWPARLPDETLQGITQQ